MNGLTFSYPVYADAPRPMVKIAALKPLFVGSVSLEVGQVTETFDDVAGRLIGEGVAELAKGAKMTPRIQQALDDARRANPPAKPPRPPVPKVEMVCTLEPAPHAPTTRWQNERSIIVGMTVIGAGEKALVDEDAAAVFLANGREGAFLAPGAKFSARGQVYYDNLVNKRSVEY